MGAGVIEKAIEAEFSIRFFLVNRFVFSYVLFIIFGV